MCLCVLHACMHLHMACTCASVCTSGQDVCILLSVCACTNVNSMNLYARVNAHAQVREVSVLVCTCQSTTSVIITFHLFSVKKSGYKQILIRYSCEQGRLFFFLCKDTRQKKCFLLEISKEV